MKKKIILRKKNNYWLSNEHNNNNLIPIVAFITDYGNDVSWILSLWNINKWGIAGGSMEVVFEDNLVHIQPLFCDDAENYRVTLSKNTLKFLIDRWQELIQLKPDSITIFEENGQYLISAEFNAPNTEIDIQT